MSGNEAHFVAAAESWRGLIFLGGFVLLAGLQNWRPRRPIDRLADRWRVNLSFGLVNMVLVRLVVPGGLVGLATLTAGGGLLGWLALPLWASYVVALVLLDLTLYAQHRALHRVAFLWPLHAPHHADRALDVSSGLRFHPGEAVFSAGVKAAAIVALGASPGMVLVFEITLSLASLFTHANWALGRADQNLQRLIVTPDMHRLHHSRRDTESQRNFGFFLSCWDRLFGSYQAQPSLPHRDMAMGLEGQEDDRLGASLKAPWVLWRRLFH